MVGRRAGVAGRSLNRMLCVLKQGQFKAPYLLGPEPWLGGSFLYGEVTGLPQNAHSPLGPL